MALFRFDIEVPDDKAQVVHDRMDDLLEHLRFSADVVTHMPSGTCKAALVYDCTEDPGSDVYQAVK